jgi:DUF4097 and DUF4098 domain-containing protein YvlB
MLPIALTCLRQVDRTILICLLLVPFTSASDWKYEETHSDVRDFVSGGILHVRLSVGDIHITRGDANKIRLRYTVKRHHRSSSVKDEQVDFDVHGNDANIEFRAPGWNNTEFDVELEIPQNTSLDIHDKVGDLTIEDIVGDKDLTLSVGDIRLARSSADCRRVDASTSIGDVNGNGYGETTGWLGKTLKYHGDGKYELRAHVSVGDITLEGK